MKIAFIGLGHLGCHLAHSLLEAGVDLTVCDLNEEAAASLIDKGARFAGTPLRSDCREPGQFQEATLTNRTLVASKRWRRGSNRVSSS